MHEELCIHVCHNYRKKTETKTFTSDKGELVETKVVTEVTKIITRESKEPNFSHQHDKSHDTTVNDTMPPKTNDEVDEQNKTTSNVEQMKGDKYEKYDESVNFQPKPDNEREKYSAEPNWLSLPIPGSSSCCLNRSITVKRPHKEPQVFHFFLEEIAEVISYSCTNRYLIIIIIVH